jgi:hypothetical protein
LINLIFKQADVSGLESICSHQCCGWLTRNTDSRVARDVPVYNSEVAELPEELAALPILRIALHRN